MNILSFFLLKELSKTIMEVKKSFWGVSLPGVKKKFKII